MVNYTCSSFYRKNYSGRTVFAGRISAIIEASDILRDNQL